MTRAADVHRSYDRDRDKSLFTLSDVDPVPGFVQANHPVSDFTTPPSSDDLPAILHFGSKRTDAAQRPPSL